MKKQTVDILNEDEKIVADEFALCVKNLENLFEGDVVLRTALINAESLMDFRNYATNQLDYRFPRVKSLYAIVEVLDKVHTTHKVSFRTLLDSLFHEWKLKQFELFYAWLKEGKWDSSNQFSPNKEPRIQPCPMPTFQKETSHI